VDGWKDRRKGRKKKNEREERKEGRKGGREGVWDGGRKEGRKEEKEMFLSYKTENLTFGPYMPLMQKPPPNNQGNPILFKHMKLINNKVTIKYHITTL
jgi:hypothetical protein